MQLAPVVVVVALALVATAVVLLAALWRAVTHRWRRRLLPPLPAPSPGAAVPQVRGALLDVPLPAPRPAPAQETGTVAVAAPVAPRESVRPG